MKNRVLRKSAWILITSFYLSGNGYTTLASAYRTGYPETKKVKISYNNGLNIESVDGHYSLKMQFLLQPQFQIIESDKKIDANTFLIRRGQMRFGGNFFNPKLKYKVMFELPGTQGGATSNLRDMWVDWQWKKFFQIKFGQFLVSYDHENLEPSWVLQFVDRSLINANLGFERDLGIDIHGTIFSDRMEYDFFLINGDGRNQVNLDSKLVVGGRVVANILGKHNYLTSNPNKSEKAHLAIGVAAIHDKGRVSISNNKLTHFTCDIGFRYLGFSTLTLINVVDNLSIGKSDYGYLGQVGYFLISSRLELAGRWARIIQDGALGSDTLDPKEAGVALSYFLNDHSVKLQADYSHLLNNAATQDRNDDRVRLQLQLFF